MRVAKTLGHVLLDEAGTQHAEARLLDRGQHVVQGPRQFPDRRRVTPNRALNPQVAAPVFEQPVGRVAQQSSRLEHRRVLHGRRSQGVECLDLRPDVARREHLARDAVGARDGGGLRAGVVLHAHGKHGSHAVDEAVGDRRRDDFAAQSVALQARARSAAAPARGNSAPVPRTDTDPPERRSGSTPCTARSCRKPG